MTNQQETFEAEIVQTDLSGLAVLSTAEIDQQIATAKRFPRSIKEFRTEALELITLTEEIAASCIYALPRKERGVVKNIEGPSARFAEMVAYSWKNSRAGAKVIGEDKEFVIAQGFFYDLERNNAVTFEVKRRIVDSYGKRYKTDMIGVTGNAAASIAFRNAVLKGVPKAIWQEMYDAARKTAVGDIKTLVNKRSDMIGYFAKMGVSAEMICKALGLPGIEDIGLDELVTLKGFATALKEGESTIEQMFKPAEKPNTSAAFTTDPAKTDCPKCKQPRPDGACHTPACPDAVPPGA